MAVIAELSSESRRRREARAFGNSFVVTRDEIAVVTVDRALLHVLPCLRANVEHTAVDDAAARAVPKLGRPWLSAQPPSSTTRS
jgi:hypothetical protein